MVGAGDNTFTKTICSICYEDLKPIVEDLQSISICGHVFHELCLQQWFEYCTNSKKLSCPVCKQGCSKKNVSRLYFQSVGDPYDPVLSESRKAVDDSSECPDLLRREVKRLEAKVSGLSVLLEKNEKNAKELTEELHVCKEQLAQEVKLRTNAFTQKKSVEEMLRIKSSELVRSNLECSKLQERNLAMAKELAALKLVSDCNLEEEEIVRLASLGNEANRHDAIDVLKKSLVIRNRSYKELMAKCNTLGRGEAYSLRKLEKAKEKITKLKGRVQELETAIEAKDNEVLRMIKASRKLSKSIDETHKSLDAPTISKHTVRDLQKEPTPTVINLDDDVSGGGNLFDNLLDVKETKNNHLSINDIKDGSRVCPELAIGPNFLVDDGVSYKSRTLHEVKLEGLPSKGRTLGDYDINKDAELFRLHGQSETPSLRTAIRNEINDSAADEGAVLQFDKIRQVLPSFHSIPETTSPILLAEPGDVCFAGGLLGPDGSNRYLGKWCKRAQNKGSTMQNQSGSLIAVGADGRGGRVKVLRSPSHSSLDERGAAFAKRCKLGGKTSSSHSSGRLQIEHFFGKANN